MRVYLAINSTLDIKDLIPGSDILAAYPYLKSQKGMIDLIPSMRHFLLDSGVFTMINTGKRFDLNKYVDEYADFIRDNHIRQYVELDVDQIIGVKETRNLRDRLEKRVGYPSIPVWHTIRGKELFIRDCKDYNYIALGYFLTEGLKEQYTFKYAKAFVDEAHKYKCRIHGLGFTKTQMLKKIPFDSVDSSTWSTSRRYGSIFKFVKEEGYVRSISRDKSLRMKNASALGRLAFIEWKKYQDWAEDNLRCIW